MKTYTAQQTSRILHAMASMADEADLIDYVHNMASTSGYHGTTTADLIDCVCENYSMTVYYYVRLRSIVFTPITNRSFAFKTEKK